MKKWWSKILICIMILIVGCGLIYIPVKADSGWDYDYDYDYGGSDWDYDYDYDSDWDYDWGGGSYSSGYGGSSTFAGFVVVLFIIMVLIVIASKNNGTKKMKYLTNSKRRQSYTSNSYQDIEISRVMEIDPNLNIEEFKKMVFNTYRDLQIAWMNFDTDMIRKLTTDEVYNMYSSQLEVLKLKGQKNIMKDITLVDVKIIDIEKANDIITTKVFLRVKCYDYVIKENNGAVVRGTENLRVEIDYILTFVKSANDNRNEEKCPNCGAPVEIKTSSNCSYCDSTLVKDASDYVMSKKVVVGQRLDR